MQNYSSDEEISSIPEDEYLDYDRQDFEAIQFANIKQNISEDEQENEDDDEEEVEQEKDNKLQKIGIKFKLPQRNQVENKKSLSNLNNQKVLTEATNQLKNISKIENRPSTSQSYKPIYTTSIHQSQQMQKKYNYKQKSFNTLPKRSDPVARYQQMSSQWKKTKFLQNTNGLKEGRKLNLDTRIEQQKQELKESGMFHRYIAKSQLFL
ncbi:unnamed protein product (macronuclear) [Paramecium tetraurelia]|uniref:Uncharacterized protein n=1 Tax=Paramecium tetraurelia TaxID=5888 RepID=A0E2G9_PARTE|nr:uncharacterized protein GSPATT00022658001 [Paramecium tetraurelia]CAK89486.1 unnamed protein product [Paramecium tetraurelia]|eukprot:XP_001456883.1 hypothetical protein (macronuclear) [Paramecium tetraurelia strain d4-2]